MKCRNGFVSNSSSSSFMIAIGKNKNFDDIFDENKLKLSGCSPLANVLAPTVSQMVKTIKSRAHKVTLKEWLEEHGYDSTEEAIEEYDHPVLKYFKDGWKVYCGCFSTNSGGVESFLCYSATDTETDDFVFISDYGY